MWGYGQSYCLLTSGPDVEYILAALREGTITFERASDLLHEWCDREVDRAWIADHEYE